MGGQGIGNKFAGGEMGEMGAVPDMDSPSAPSGGDAQGGAVMNGEQ